MGVSDAAQTITKTNKAVDLLKSIGVYADVAKSAKSKNIRRGKGKMRNRRYTCRKGPLVVVTSADQGLAKSVRNLPGVDVANVERLNLLDLAPGGHLGRLCIWTKSAFAALDSMYSGDGKFALPENVMTNADLSRLINSDEIQSVVRQDCQGPRREEDQGEEDHGQEDQGDRKEVLRADLQRLRVRWGGLRGVPGMARIELSISVWKKYFFFSR